jgi:hypothetical protein
VPNVGQADGVNGDLALLALPFIVTHDEIDLIVQRLRRGAPRHRSGSERLRECPCQDHHTSTSGDLGEFHHRFDVALDAVRAATGARHPFYVGDRRSITEVILEDRSPVDTGPVLGRFAMAAPSTWSGRSRPPHAQRGWRTCPGGSGSPSRVARPG